MKQIAIVAYQQTDSVSDAGAVNEVELIMPVLARTFKQVGLNNAQDVDFVCSGSCDYLQGAAFAFVAGVDALGALPGTGIGPTAAALPVRPGNRRPFSTSPPPMKKPMQK